MVESLLKQAEALERRLHEGWDVVNKAEGTDNFERYEEFWLGLLAEYEETFDRAWGRK